MTDTATNIRSVVEAAITDDLGELYDGYVVMDIYDGYTEPGYYTDTDSGVVVSGDWNPKRFVRQGDPPLTRDENIGPRLAEALELLGADVVWHDEWVRCCECELAMRCQPDSYSWTMYGAFVMSDYVCADCMVEDLDSYLEDYVNDSDRAVTWCDGNVMADNGWTKWEPRNPHTYETGWHPGQNDKPKPILAEIHREDSNTQVVFLIDTVGQFDMRWSAWTKKENKDD